MEPSIYIYMHIYMMGFNMEVSLTLGHPKLSSKKKWAFDVILDMREQDWFILVCI